MRDGWKVSLTVVQTAVKKVVYLVASKVEKWVVLTVVKMVVWRVKMKVEKMVAS